jgi:preprotein translocase subunit SecD
MRRNLQYRFLIIFAVIAVSFWMFYPPGEKINLGLDLRGGMHLVLQVNTRDALEMESNQAREQIDSELRRRDIPFDQVRVTQDLRIEVIGVPRDQEAVVQDLLRDYAGSWDSQVRYAQNEVNFVMTMQGAARRGIAEMTVRQARETIANRIDQYGVAEPTIAIYGSGEVPDQIIVEMPGVDDPDRVLRLIRDVAQLELKVVHAERGGPYTTRDSAMEAFGHNLPPGYEILPYRNVTETGGQTMYMVVSRAASITGQHLKNARRSEDSLTGRAEVIFFLNSEGVRRFTRVTEQNVGNRLAIVLDSEIRSAPNIQERIASDSARITGQFTREQAEDLALTLRSGALPASVNILENRIVGPSLGMDSIRRGITASLIGLALVVAGMLVFYRLSGINAVICLALNLLILMGVLGYFNATLTLPGIAGVILTIGMAVDANILIFERIKEELRTGKTIRAAVESGFDRVFVTILDTNITTLIAALFLFQFGTGPVRGFAVTLAVGLTANIFAATFVSRSFFEMVLQRWQPEKLSI